MWLEKVVRSNGVALLTFFYSIKTIFPKSYENNTVNYYTMLGVQVMHIYVFV